MNSEGEMAHCQEYKVGEGRDDILGKGKKSIAFF